MRPIVLNLDGGFRLSHEAICVGTAVQPYHAVPLAQVKKMLSILTVVSSVFRVGDEWMVSDRVIGFCLSEPGGQEQFDYIYTGKIVDETKFITDKVIAPPTKQVVQDIMTTADVFNPFVLSEPNYTTGEQWDYVYTGKFVDEIVLEDIPIAVSLVKISESITLLSASLSYTLTETGWSDGNLDYVYMGTGVDTVHIEEIFSIAVKTVTADTITVFDTNTSDVVFVDILKEVVVYPDDGLVLQKIKPLPKETKVVGDAVIIKRKYKITDSCAFKDNAFACCLSDAFVAEMANQIQFAKIREAVTAGSTPANSTIDAV
jgi:hypothetical protein